MERNRERYLFLLMFPSYRPAIMDRGLIQPSPAGSHFPNSTWLLAEDAERVGPVS
ncbi:MAG: hypothetical protein ACRD1C_04310 [Terriglobales bacterium]